MGHPTIYHIPLGYPEP